MVIMIVKFRYDNSSAGPSGRITIVLTVGSSETFVVPPSFGHSDEVKLYAAFIAFAFVDLCGCNIFSLM